MECGRNFTTRKGKDKLNPLICKHVTGKLVIVYFQIALSSVLSEELSFPVEFTSHVITSVQDVAPDMDGRCIVLKPGQERLCIIIIIIQFVIQTRVLYRDFHHGEKPPHLVKNLDNFSCVFETANQLLTCRSQSHECIAMCSRFETGIHLFGFLVLFSQHRLCDDTQESISFQSWTFSCLHTVYLMNTTKVRTSQVSSHDLH